MSWAAMLRFAVVQLGLTPDAFWRLSLVEWRWLTEPIAGEAPLSRAAFEALSAAYPD